MEIYANVIIRSLTIIKRPLATLWQNFIVRHQMAHCDILLIFDISLWESPRPHNQAVFSKISSRILVGTIATLVWDDNLHTANAINTNVLHCLWWQLGKSALSRKKVDWDRTKVMVDHKCLSGGRGRSFECCQGLYTDTDIKVRQNGGTSWKMPLNWWAVPGSRRVLPYTSSVPQMNICSISVSRLKSIFLLLAHFMC